MKCFRTNVTVCNGYFVAAIALITLFAASCQSGASSGQHIQSGGLGLSRTEWERQHGPAASQDSGYDYYDDDHQGRFIVNFLGGGAVSIKRSYGDSAGVTLQEARSQSKELIPGDSRLVRTYNASAGPVDLYFSDTLKRIFPSDDYWTRGEPGNFIVLYFSNHDIVDSFVIGLGNNP